MRPQSKPAALSLAFLPIAALALFASGCSIHHTVDPVEITLNLKLETAEEELDDFFSDLDESNDALN